MFTLSFGKIILTVLVIVLLWRGLRMVQAIQARAASRPASPPPQAAKATDLVECPRCGLFVPNGTLCHSKDDCRYRRP